MTLFLAEIHSHSGETATVSPVNGNINLIIRNILFSIPIFLYNPVRIDKMSFLDCISAVFVVVFFACSRQNEEKTILGRESTASLRGLAMLLIILHHIHNRFGFYSPILTQVGYLTTGVFFFVSGYGNMFSINK